MKKNLLLPIFLFSLGFQTFFASAENMTGITEERFPMADESSKTISKTQYIGGGLAGVFLGLGIGHAIQNRYNKKAWIFTAGNILLYSQAFFTFRNIMSDRKASDDIRFIKLSDNTSINWLSFIGLGIKLWEAVDVWMLPSNYKMVKEVPFTIKPLAFYDPENRFHYGLSLNYQF